MSSLKIVQRPLFELPDIAFATEEVAETGGMVFANGRCIELIRSDGRLGLLDSSNKKVAEKIEYQGRTFVPPTVHPSILEVLTLPTGALLLVRLRTSSAECAPCLWSRIFPKDPQGS